MTEEEYKKEIKIMNLITMKKVSMTQLVAGSHKGHYHVTHSTEAPIFTRSFC